MRSVLLDRRAVVLVGLMLGVAVIAAALFIAAPGARAQATGEINGVISGQDTGLPLQGAAIYVYRASDRQVVTWTTTEIDGYYTFDLPETDYLLRVDPQDDTHYATWYEDQLWIQEADRVPVTGGGVTTVNIACPVGGEITGTVSDAESGNPLPDYPLDIWFIEWYVHTGEKVRVSPTGFQTEADGTYTLTGLAPGPYKIEAKAPEGDLVHVLDWWYGDVPTEEQADVASVVPPNTTEDVDLHIPAGGFVLGTVTDTADNPVGDVQCTAYRFNSELQTWTSVGSTATSGEVGSMGQYRLGPLPEGSYKMEFVPDNEDPDHADTIYYRQKSTIEEANYVPVVAHENTTGIDAVITRSAQIHGMVTASDQYHDIIDKVRVTAYRKSGGSWVSVASCMSGDPDKFLAHGEYFISRLPAGEYKFQFSPARSLWRERWYHNTASLNGATVVDLEEGDDKRIDQQLPWQNHEIFGVTPPEHSDFGTILGSLGYSYDALEINKWVDDVANFGLLKQFDAVFLNCSKEFLDWYEGGKGSPSAVARYVSEGGKVFCSCDTLVQLNKDFPGAFTLPNPPQQGEKQNVTAKIKDTKMQAYLGATTLPIKFDEQGCTIVTGKAATATTNIAADMYTNYLGKLIDCPICVTYPYGSGQLYYQAFHVDKQTGTTAKGIMSYFLGAPLKRPQISGVTPPRGVRGSTVTISGANFGASKVSSSYVTFNGVKATEYSYWSSTTVKAKVPSSASTGQLLVTNSGGTSNSVHFEVTDAPTPTPTAWYLAEGSSNWGYETFVTIENPNSKAVTAQVTYMTDEGPVGRPDLRLPACSQTTINPRNDIGARDFSTKVVCRDGKMLAVDRRMIWTGPGAPSQEGSSSIAVTAPSLSWFLPEGSSKWGFETWLLIQNPNSKPASCTITFMREGEGPKGVTKTVQANSRASFNMESEIGAKDASIRVTSKTPVIAERAMYRNNRREGHESIGATAPASTFYLAEGTTNYGFTTYILVQNPNSSNVNVTLTYMTQSGPRPQPPFSMPANSRKTVRVNDVLDPIDFSTKVEGSRPIIAERAMYWGEGSALGEACHDSIGLAAPYRVFYLPDGETQNGYETWTLVQNPNSSAVGITINYFTPTGEGNKTVRDTIPANTRKTYNMADAIPNGKAAVMVTCTTSGKRIMVERAMYWNNRGAGTDTIGGYSN